MSLLSNYSVAIVIRLLSFFILSLFFSQSWGAIAPTSFEHPYSYNGDIKYSHIIEVVAEKSGISRKKQGISLEKAKARLGQQALRQVDYLWGLYLDGTDEAGKKTTQHLADVLVKGAEMTGTEIVEAISKAMVNSLADTAKTVAGTGITAAASAELLSDIYAIDADTVKQIKAVIGAGAVFGIISRRTGGVLDNIWERLGTKVIPSKATDTLAHIRKTGDVPSGYKGGGKFNNDGRSGGQRLPQKDASGNPITYKEYDVNPYQKGVNRGTERIVRGSDGKSYYTNDHYKTFTPIE